MGKCALCGIEHEVLDPTFRRPDAFVRLDPETRNACARADDDLCRIALPATSPRHFIRGTLPVLVTDRPEELWWGLWAEVSEQAFERVLALWSDPDQHREPPFDGECASVIPTSPDTLGLKRTIRLTGPTSRPEFRFAPGVSHPFVQECESGIDSHRAEQWNELLKGGRHRRR
jgi:hypothetical protein